MKHALFTLPVSALLAGCLGAGALPDTPSCADTPTAITLEELSALGFSGADLLTLAEGEHVGTLTWYPGGDTEPADERDTPLLLTVRYDGGGVRHVASEAVYPEGDEGAADIAIVCEDRIEVDVTLAISTDDGGLDEVYALALASTDGLRATATVTFDHSTMGGSYQYTLDHPLDTDSVTHSLYAAFDEAGSGGEIVATAGGCYDGHDSWDDCTTRDCNCWSSSDTVARWWAETPG